MFCSRLAKCAICSLLLSQSGFAEQLTEAAKTGDHRALVRLLNNHANPDEPDADGSTPLLWAANNGDLEMARLLLGAGAKANSANRLGITPLMLAATNGSQPMVRECICYDPRLSIRIAKPISPL